VLRVSLFTDGIISLWTLQDGSQTWGNITAEKEVARKALRGQACDIYDIAWSPDSSHLVSGSIDGSVWVWDVAPAPVTTSAGASDDAEATVAVTDQTPAIHHVIKKPTFKLDRIHSHYVQGLCWDPFQQYFCTQSSDRTCRIMSNFLKHKSRNFKETSKRFRCITIIGSVQKDRKRAKGNDTQTPEANTSQANEQQPDQQQQPQQQVSTSLPDDGAPSASPSAPVPASRTRVDRLFLDESLPTFFRRPAWSPDGTLLVLPAGKWTKYICRIAVYCIVDYPWLVTLC
jgi:chromatin assembly factor 1 subunit B